MNRRNKKYDTIDERILSNIVRIAGQMVSKPAWVRRTYLRHSIGTVSNQQLDGVIERHKIRSREGNFGVISYSVEDAERELCKLLDAGLDKSKPSD